jgi:hypothetical protein
MSVFNENNNDTLFELSEKINCEDISCNEASRDRSRFFDRAVDCSAYGNEKNREYYTNHSMMDYLAYDKFITNKCNPYVSKNTIPPSKNCLDFECNDNVSFVLKPHNVHTYKNGIRFHPSKEGETYRGKPSLGKYCSYNQVWHNIRDKYEIPQNCEKINGNFEPRLATMEGCKPIRNIGVL